MKREILLIKAASKIFSWEFRGLKGRPGEGAVGTKNVSIRVTVELGVMYGFDGTSLKL
jgi:hypothetical protein